MEINLSFSTQIRVRYSETDQMGYCYYGNYASYFEVGRVEALRSIGMNYKNLEDMGYMLPVSEFSIKYILPATYDELLTIHTTIESILGSRIVFNYKINNEKNQLICKAQTTLVFISKTDMRPLLAPDFFLELFKSKTNE